MRRTVTEDRDHYQLDRDPIPTDVCPHCYYDLMPPIDREPVRCPECGGAFTTDELTQRWRVRRISLVGGTALLLGPPLFAMPFLVAAWPVAIVVGALFSFFVANSLDYMRLLRLPSEKRARSPLFITLLTLGFLFVQTVIAVLGCGCFIVFFY